jgi:hypothetical protein
MPRSLGTVAGVRCAITHEEEGVAHDLISFGCLAPYPVHLEPFGFAQGRLRAGAQSRGLHNLDSGFAHLRDARCGCRPLPKRWTFEESDHPPEKPSIRSPLSEEQRAAGALDAEVVEIHVEPIDLPVEVSSLGTVDRRHIEAKGEPRSKEDRLRRWMRSPSSVLRPPFDREARIPVDLVEYRVSLSLASALHRPEASALHRVALEHLDAFARQARCNDRQGLERVGHTGVTPRLDQQSVKERKDRSLVHLLRRSTGKICQWVGKPFESPRRRRPGGYFQ